MLPVGMRVIATSCRCIGCRSPSWRSIALMLAVTLAGLTGAAPPAMAQSLLQSLFGFGGPSPSRAPPPMPQTYPLRSAPYFYAPNPGRDAFGGGLRADGGAGGGNGSYRTMCVRLCDGFYWPISHGVARARFTRDANACQSSCGMDARLFYQSGEGSPESMVDLGGRAYSMLPNAYRYRKALVPGCACKPAPWSEAEAARHHRYAATETSIKSGLATARAGQVAAADSTIQPAIPAPAPAPVSADARPAIPTIAAASRETPVKAATNSAPSRPAVVVAQRAALATLPPIPPVARPPARMGIGGPPAATVKGSGNAAVSGPAKPVYSHDLGRFVFPGESRNR